MHIGFYCTVHVLYTCLLSLGKSGEGLASFDGVSIIEEERGGLERREGGREEVRKGETDIHVENKIRGYETKV